MSAPDTRRRLLDAAARVIRAVGPGALTLDAVAREAGVSKGGLLYHFATKEALVDALVADWLDRFEAQIADRAAERGWARAYAEACTASSADERATDVAMLAALVGDPARLEPVRRRYAAWQERLRDDGGQADDGRRRALAGRPHRARAPGGRVAPCGARAPGRRPLGPLRRPRSTRRRWPAPRR